MVIGTAFPNDCTQWGNQYLNRELKLVLCRCESLFFALFQQGRNGNSTASGRPRAIGFSLSGQCGGITASQWSQFTTCDVDVSSRGMGWKRSDGPIKKGVL